MINENYMIRCPKRIIWSWWTKIITSRISQDRSMQLSFTLFVIESGCPSVFLGWGRLFAPIAEEAPNAYFSYSYFFIAVSDSFAFPESLHLDFSGTSMENH